MVYARGQYFICDTEKDLQDLPTNREPGSVAKVIDPNSLYMLNNEGKWLQIRFMFDDIDNLMK